MFNPFSSNSAQILSALDKSFAIIEFDLDGKILKANENFYDLMEYSPEEIIGKHHRMFLDADYAASPEYAAFWSQLRGGKFECSEFKRYGKNGKEVFIRGNYNPIFNLQGIVKFANDITATKLAQLESTAKTNAVDRAQAVIEFTPDGRILTANRNFLDALGYRLDEVVGQYHRMFVEPAFANSPAYAAFWAKLQRGEFVADEFRRIGKGGKFVYIQASYNPIFDLNGKVVKVVKYATDVTTRVIAVQELGGALGKLADGDLVQRLPVPFMPALEPLRVSFNASVEHMQDTLRSVGENAAAIHTGADQIRMSADDLARRTEQQAAALEQTSAALSEITMAVGSSSKRADEAGTLVARTKAGAERSGQVVSKAIAAMAEIEQSSEEIGKIIGVIDEIAFQTNLLALNAGVEAARAGEAGRGFAVVAQEVRGLAQRSAEAAKEIKNLISTSSRQVGAGVELVGETGKSLEMIVQEVTEIHEHVASIVKSARSQAVGLNEINIAIGTLNQGTQQNAAMVEESTAASNELASEVASLNKQLGQFKTDADHVTLPAHGRGASIHTLRPRASASF